jgi:hypothetical protein
MQRNCYCSLKAPSFSPFSEVPTPPKALDWESASGPISGRGWQADGCLNELAYFLNGTGACG